MLFAQVSSVEIGVQFFQIFVYGDIIYAQTWEVLTLKTV